MKTKKTAPFQTSMKFLFIIPVIILALFAIFSCTAGKKSAAVQAEVPPPPTSPPVSGDIQDTTPFVVVEEMPRFPGGDSTLLKYIAENVRYPEAAKQNKVQGRVIVRFCINTAGGVERVSVIKGVTPELDNEALRVVSTLPDFLPGKQGGEVVPVWYMVPITFALK